MYIFVEYARCFNIICCWYGLYEKYECKSNIPTLNFVIPASFSWKYTPKNIFQKNISIFMHDFIVSYNKKSDFGYTLIVDVDYPEYLQPLHRDLSFAPGKIVINKEKS